MASEFDPVRGAVRAIAYGNAEIHGDCLPIEVFSDSVVPFLTSGVACGHWIVI